MIQPSITGPIIGPRPLEQLEDNLAALAVTVTADDCRRVDALVAPKTAVAAFYEADFGPHQYRW